MKEERNHCILCNLNSTTYIYAFLLPISCMCIHVFQDKMFKISKPKDSFKMLKYNLPLLFYYFLPKTFSIIFIIIIKFKTKEESDTKETNKLLRRYHFFITNENKKKIYFLIFFVSILEVIYKIDDSLLLYLNRIEKIKLLVEKRSGFIIFVPLFSYFILNKILYKHHIFALILSIIGSLIINISRFCLGFSLIDNFFYHLINILFSSFFSFALVLTKYVMVKYIITPYNFLFYDGIFCIINSLIWVLLEYVVVININDSENKILQNENENYFINNYYEIINIFIGQDSVFYLYFFLSIIASFGYFIFNILTIFNFSPYLNVLTDFLTPFLIYNISFIFEEKSSQKVTRFFCENIGYVLVILGALILNEIIILNFCNLNENTYLSISRRGRIDSINGLEEFVPNENDDNEDDDNDNDNELKE